MGNSVFINEHLTERNLIESILSSYYILDYGFIKAVNSDETIDVTHAKQLKTYDNQSLKATVTTGVEVLTLCGGGFSFKFDYKKGDKVLLLGLKNYIPKVNDVTQATETTAYLHYTRETMKAIPLCVFNGDAKVRVVVKEGKMAITTEDVLTLDGDDNGGVVIGPELKTQLGYLTNRVDTIINALQNAPTVAEDGGAAYKAGISSVLETIAKKEDFSKIESDKVKHGTGGQ